MKLLRPLPAFVLIMSCVSSFAGTYGPQNFNSLAVGATDAGGGTVMFGSINTPPVANPVTIQNRPGSTADRALRLTYLNTNSILRGNFTIPVLDAGQVIKGFDVSFKMMQRAPDLMADGVGLTFGNLAAASNTAGSGERGFRALGSLIISFDPYTNVDDSAPWIDIRASDAHVAGVPQSYPLNDTTFHEVAVHWDADGVDLSYDGVARFTDVAVPAFVPAAGNQFAFSARTQGSDEEAMIDDIAITTWTTDTPPPPANNVIISEFLADNGDGIEDEDAQASDWIELYNINPTAVNLAGWRLTNDAANLAMWTLPAVSIPANGYLRIFASGKNRTAPAGVLHTNFTLDKAGGYLALVKPDGTTKASEFNYGPQSEDVSFGTWGAAQTQRYLLPPTPGTNNEAAGVLAADGPPAEEVIFDRPGGLITGAVTLTVTPPVGAGAVVRYTEDGTVPGENDPEFPAAGANIAASKEIRARTFQPGRLPGDVNSRTFLLLDANLTSYGTTGQPFRSNLPIIVVESWGVNVDATKNPNNPRPFRPVYTVVLGKDTAVNNRAHLDGPVDFQGRGGMHVRGESSSDFGQRPYEWETWTNENRDKSVSILGLPPDGDWVLQSMFNDKTLMRNMLPYTLMREAAGGSWDAPRGQFVEVFFNQDGGPISYADYRGVYLLNERIERGSDRVDIAKISPLATSATTLSGGYIWKRDKPIGGAGDFSTTSTQAWGTQPLWMVEPEQFTAAQTTALKGHVQAFDNALSGPNYTDSVAGYKAHIEPQTFMDNHLWVEVFKQIDGFWLSTYYSKDRGGKIRALPIWDYNLSAGNANYGNAENTTSWFYTGTGGQNYPYYPRLFQDADFTLQYWDRYWRLRRSVFATTYMLAKMDAWVNELTDGQPAVDVVSGASVLSNRGDFDPRAPANILPPSLESPARIENAIMRHFDRWPILGVYVWPNPTGFDTRNTFQKEVQWMKDWLTAHLTWIDSQHTKPPTFSHSGGNVAAGTALTITNPNTGTGTIYYTLNGSDPSSAGTGGPSVTLVPAGAAVRWIVPTAANGGNALTAAAGAQQWTTFTDPPNLVNWSTGVTGVGYERNPLDATNYTALIGAGSDTTTAMYNVNQTCYLRVAFTIPDQATPDAVSTLTLSMKYDDGFRAYINGVNVTGRNDTHATMTSSPWSAQASQAAVDTNAVAYESIDITTLGKPALRAGTNALAIHGLNSGAGSSDFIISPLLTWQAAGTGPRVYSGPLALNSSALVRARVNTGTQAAPVWSPITEASFVVAAAPASAANLVVSEFACDPPASGNYSSKDLEFIVLRNISAGGVDLSGVQFTDGVTFTLTGSPQQMTLAAGGEIVIAANVTALAAVYGPAPAGTTLLGPFAGALNNTGELLSIRTAAGAVIKEFTYSNIAPWPDAAGASLVLISPATNPNHNVAANWRTSLTTPWSEDAGPWLTDTDGDGFPDGVEYLLGTLSNSAASIPQISVTAATETVSGVTGRFLRFTFRRSDATDRGTATPELSANLTTWQPAAFTRIASQNNGDGTLTETWRTTAPVISPEAFARLRLTGP